jgi:hypothetical protein
VILERQDLAVEASHAVSSTRAAILDPLRYFYRLIATVGDRPTKARPGNINVSESFILCSSVASVLLLSVGLFEMLRMGKSE